MPHDQNHLPTSMLVEQQIRHQVEGDYESKCYITHKLTWITPELLD